MSRRSNSAIFTGFVLLDKEDAFKWKVSIEIQRRPNTTDEDLMHPEVRRVYEEPGPRDGTRILVDRLWPRGIAKQRLDHDRWLKEIAPSTALRKWYGHQPARWDEFRRRYRDELQKEPRAGLVVELHEIGEHRSITLLTATKDVDHSAAAVLAEVLGEASGPKEPPTRVLNLSPHPGKRR